MRATAHGGSAGQCAAIAAALRQFGDVAEAEVRTGGRGRSKGAREFRHVEHDVVRGAARIIAGEAGIAFHRDRHTGGLDRP